MDPSPLDYTGNLSDGGDSHFKRIEALSKE